MIKITPKFVTEIRAVRGSSLMMVGIPEKEN